MADLDNEPSSYEKAEYEAAVWVIRLGEAPEDTELQAEFESWRGESELNADLYDDTQAASDLIEKSEAVTRDKWGEAWVGDGRRNNNEVVAPTAFPATQSLIQRLYSIMADWRKMALPVALACCLVFIFAPMVQLRMQADYLTTTAEQQTLTLDDGSQVTLAPESAISVEFSSNKRQLHLLKGRAFFKISADASRPFSVQAGATQATVLGTAFNVYLGDDSTTVTVAEGHVRVNDSTITPMVAEELHAGDRLQVTWHKGVARDQMLTDEIAAWRQGELIAHNMPMGDIVGMLRTYHQGAIVIQSSSFSKLRVSGLYKLNDPIATLNSLAAAYGASVTQVSPWLLVVSD